MAEGVHICPGAHLAGEVSVGSRTWIGIGASVIQQVSIGCDVIVGAGAAVVSDLPNNVTAVGVPARFFNLITNLLVFIIKYTPLALVQAFYLNLSISLVNSRLSFLCLLLCFMSFLVTIFNLLPFLHNWPLGFIVYSLLIFILQLFRPFYLSTAFYCFSISFFTSIFCFFSYLSRYEFSS